MRPILSTIAHNLPRRIFTNGIALTSTITTLPALCDFIAFDIERAPGAAKTLPQGQLGVSGHQAVDVLSDLSASYCGQYKPHADCVVSRRRHHRRVRKAAQAQFASMGLITIIGGAVLSWIVEKFLDAFWAWYWGEPKAVELCTAMSVAARLPAWPIDTDGPDSSDEGSD